MDFNINNNFLDSVNPLDINSSIPSTRDVKNSVHAIAMINGCTMQEYLEQLISNEINHFDSQKYSDYKKIKFYLDARYLKKDNLKSSRR
ncbi:hypothetical protein DN452_09905 [Lactobacillus reuteri]|nr:hypothetical protein [Limosilactobacillus reuteri]MQB79725.1 hypothetical protein [Limosilactobacillus reuteri]MQB81578.1 hypothetical protein [Limosilactobacillus reuteri]MQB83472.1 hypothetical protein [Limosilactobacillus reuteri]MQB87936.1 hypothetical protein [Limosilactobacillus reuteri]